MGIGLMEGVLIAAIVILLFGSKKIPQLGKTLGESIKGFKSGMASKPEDEESETDKSNNKDKKS